MQRANLYCESEFLKDIFNQPPRAISFNEEEIRKYDLWKNYLDLITRSDIHLDIGYDQFKEETSTDFFKYLWKKSVNGECGLECDSAKFIQEDDLNIVYKNNQSYNRSFFLLKRSKITCDKLSQKYGCQTLGPDNFYSQNLIFKEHKKSIRKSTRFYFSMWKFLKDLNHPCNAFSIIDNYLLQHEWGIKKNLIPILKYLLPDHLEITFHISIFTLKEPNGRIVNFDSRKTLIEEEIKNIRPNLKFKLSIFALPDKTDHDRSFITNYLQMNSGSGFDLQGANDLTTHKTTLNAYFPLTANYISNTSDDTNQELKISMKKIFDNAVSNDNIKTYWGDKINRLFD